MKGLRKAIYIFILCDFLVILSLKAQNTIQADGKLINQQLWLDFYPHHFINEKFEYYGDTGYRTNLTDFSWHRLYIRPSVRYHLNRSFELHGGIGLFYIFHSDDFSRFEVRPWQGILAKWPQRQRISLEHLFRIEERFSFLTKSWDYSFDLRFRYKLSGTIDISRKLKTYIPFYGEVFIPLDKEFNELFRNNGRVGLGIGYDVTKDCQLEFIMNWQSSRSGPNDNLTVSDYAYQLKAKKLWNYKH